MAYGYIYEIKNLINGKVYIGQAINVMARFKEHIKKSKTATKGVDAAIRKYGAENFTAVTICSYESKQELNEAEKYFIAVYRHFYGRKGCYNQADGGQGGNLGEEANKKRSDTMKGKYVGEKNPMYGKRHTEETKKKQSDAQNGEKNHNWGKHHTEETKAKQSAAMKGKGSKQILQYDLQGNFIREWESISQAATELSLSIGNINSVCNGKRKRVGNFIFKYYKKEETI